MIDEAALLAKYHELDHEQRGVLMAIFDANGAEQARQLAIYLALDVRIQALQRKLGCADLADARIIANTEWLIHMGFEKRQAKYQQDAMLLAG